MTRPLALLIPGLDGTGNLYYRQVEALARDYRVRPWSFRPRSDFDYPDLIDEIDEGIDGECGPSTIVVGESFGGTVAMHYALSRPSCLGRLVLVNTFPYYRRRVRIRLARLLAPLLAGRVVRRLKDEIVDRVLAAEKIQQGDRERYLRIVGRIDLASYRRRLELVEKVDLRSRLEEIPVPTLLLASGRDKVVPSVKEARFMASRIPRAKVCEFPDAGHALLLTPGFSLSRCISDTKV